MSSKAGGLPTVDYNMPQIKEDITGQIINNWNVVGYSHNIRYILKGKGDSGANHFWKVRCTNCGHESTKTKGYILSKSSCSICRLKEGGAVGLNSLYANYKCGAIDRNLEFNLTKEKFKELTSSNCFYCGISPNLNTNYNSSKKWGTYQFNGIDRKDNKLGYYDSNCLSCCKTCNRAKNDMPFDEFISYLQRITAFRSKCGEIDRIVTSNFDFTADDDVIAQEQ